MKKLWQKENKQNLNPIVEAFETGDDLLLDQNLILCDVYGTMAHGLGLEKIGILNSKEIEILKKGLSEIRDLYHAGKFNLVAGDEDVHTKIENFLTEKYGLVGKKIHTGRSRNDQVLTAIRLFTREKLLNIWKNALDLCEAFISFAKEYEFVLMPGYTHMQKAMPSSVGMWAGAFAESLFDDMEILKSVYKLNNQSPLGSAAAYGVPLELPRSFVAELLGFQKVQENSLYCQNSRLHIEAYILSAFLGLLQTVNKFASDVMLFTTKEFDFFSVAENICTGSSIMPQKKNVDLAELIRSKLHLAIGNQLSVVSLSANLPSGYNRDFQDGKKPLFESLEIVIKSLVVTNILVENIEPNEDKMMEALTPEIFATHKALEAVGMGKSFREAYKDEGKKFEYQSTKFETNTNGKNSKSFKTSNLLRKSTHIGGTGNLGIKNYVLRIMNEKKVFSAASKKHYQTISRLLS